MQVLTTSGLPVSSIVWRSSAGAWVLTAVGKVTFRLEPGAAVVADSQEPIHEHDGYWNDDASCSLIAPSDLSPSKPRADVVIVGHAHAPDRAPVRSLVARVCVGQVDKWIEVRCDRSFEPDGSVREGAPFVKMPLRYERAAGGRDQWNPVGMPFDAPPDAYGRVAIANLQPPGTFLRWRGDVFGVAGLGPIAPHWPARREKLHRHAFGWSPRDWHTRPVPADIDPGYFNVAPADQQTGALRPDERLLLENLHPTHARLVTSLPGVFLRAAVDRASGRREPVALTADTLWIDTDRGICTVTWRGSIGLVHAAEEGRLHVWAEGLDLRPAADMPRRALTALSPESDANAAPAPGEPPRRPTMPFHQSLGRVSPLSVPDADKDSSPPSIGRGQTMFFSAQAAPVSEALPFGGAPASEPFPRTAAPASEAFTRAVTAAPEAPSFGPPPPSSPSIETGQTLFFSAQTAATSEALPFATAADPLPARATPVSTPEALPFAPPPPLVAFESLDATPPPRVGPLAVEPLEPLPSSPPPSAPVSPVDAAPAPPAPDSPSPAPEEASLEPDLEDYPIDRCAKIAVSIVYRPADQEKILEDNELSREGWEHVKNHWMEAIRDELGRGRTDLLKRYDTAYVAQVEAERGPIGVEEYARLWVAAERGRVGDAVAELRLPPGAPMRIERVWMDRMMNDAALGAKVRAAVDETRAA